MNCQRAQEDVAVALLTRQPVETETAAHLATCSVCAAGAAAVRPLADLLAVVEPRSVLAGDHPDPAVLERLLTEAAGRQQRRTGRWLVAVAAAMVLAIPVGIVAAHRAPTAPPVVAHTSVERKATNPVTGVSADVKLWPANFGSGLTVTLSGIPAGTKCTLSVVSKDGTRQTAATWWVSYQGPASVDGSVAASLSDIDRLEVLYDSGEIAVPVQIA